VKCGLFESGYFSFVYEYDVFMPYTLTSRKLVKVASDGDSYRGGRGIDLQAFRVEGAVYIYPAVMTTLAQGTIR